MIERYKGTFIGLIIVCFVIYLGYSNEKNIFESIKKSVGSTEAETTTIQDLKSNILPASDKNFDTSDLSPSQVEDIVKNLLDKNPEIITSALEKMQLAKMDALNKGTQDKILEFKEKLEVSTSPVIGNPDGKSIIVMFLDYNCGYCKHSADIIHKLVKKDGDIKVILKIFPILGSDSEFLAKLLTALYKSSPQNFEAIHKELLSDKILNKEDLKTIFSSNGLDLAKFEKLAESDEVKTIVKDNLELAKELGINGVPAFVINGTYSAGYLTEEQILERLNQKDSDESEQLNSDSKTDETTEQTEVISPVSSVEQSSLDTGESKPGEDSINTSSDENTTSNADEQNITNSSESTSQDKDGVVESSPEKALDTKKEPK
jgi:protein-disulfide isomerase